ncbi:MAG: hypothetical protein AAF600_20035 [Bacteroidota bacterium]
MNYLIIIICMLLSSCANAQKNDSIFSDPYEKAGLKVGSEKFQSDTKNIRMQIPKDCNNGKVFIQLNISKDGEILHNSQVLKGLCNKLDSIAIVILNEYEFFPAKKNGVLFESAIVLPIYFGTEN